MMFRVIFIFTIFVVACRADSTAGDAPPRVYCAETPNVIYSCLGNPKVVSTEITAKCNKDASECDRMKCIFSEAGWLNGETVDKPKVSQHFDGYAREHPAWSPAVQHLKAACLAHDLPAQGVFLNCPAYDIMHCILTSFIRNATPSQWSSSTSCAYPRLYAASCPVCPSACIAPAVPYGSCNACLTLPRSP